MAETTRTLITDEDAEAYGDALCRGLLRHGTSGGDTAEREALEEVAPRLRNRWVAEALEAATNELISFTDEARDAAQDSLDRARMVGLNDAGLILRAVAAEYRDGTR